MLHRSVTGDILLQSVTLILLNVLPNILLNVRMEEANSSTQVLISALDGQYPASRAGSFNRKERTPDSKCKGCWVGLHASMEAQEKALLSLTGI